MANPLKGEVEFEAGGKTYTFRLCNNELIELQTAWGLQPHEGMEFWRRIKQRQGPSGILLIFQAGLKRNHPEIASDREKLTDILDDLGLERQVTIYVEALQWTMPQAKEGDESGPKAKAGTGTKSRHQPSPQV